MEERGRRLQAGPEHMVERVDGAEGGTVFAVNEAFPNEDSKKGDLLAEPSC